MNQIRVSDDSAGTSLRAAPNTFDDQRSSLLTILSKVKQSRYDGKNTPLNTEDRESIASFLRQNSANNQHLKSMTAEDLAADNWQPNLQMFESLVSLMSN